MPFTLIRQDITHMQVDAIVNAANPELRMGGGVCGAIFRAAGPRQLQEACDLLSPIATGSAAITPGFRLPAAYIIHAAGPIYAQWSPQKALDGPCTLTTVLFDHRYELLHDRLDLRAVRPLTAQEYTVGGSTALLDAVGRTIDKLIAVQKHSAEAYRADRVLFVIITDGAENASRDYTAQQVKAMVRRQKEKYGWEFVFLGANIDAVETAGRFGIDADRAADYVPDGEGTRLNFQMMSEAAAAFRVCGRLPEESLEQIRRDKQTRSRKK